MTDQPAASSPSPDVMPAKARTWHTHPALWCAIGLALIGTGVMLAVVMLAGIAGSISGAGGHGTDNAATWLVVGLAAAGVGGVCLLVGMVLAWRRRKSGTSISTRLALAVASLGVAMVLIVPWLTGSLGGLLVLIAGVLMAVAGGLVALLLSLR